MDVMLDTESSSGCESGWTLYFEHSLLSPYPSERRITEEQSVTKFEDEEEEEDDEEEEEDLSMVSDASSGPPIFHEDECFGNANNGFFYHAAIDASLPPTNRGKREKNRGNRRPKVEEEGDPSLLDDTASSSDFDLSQNNFSVTHKEASMENMLELSQGCSATHEPFGFFQFPLSGNQLHQQNQWFGGKMGMR